MRFQPIFRFVLVLGVLVWAVGSPAEAAASPHELLDRADARFRTMIPGGPTSGMVRQDTLVVLGGEWGDGDFQDVFGEPDWEGWTHFDLNLNVGDFAQIWTFLDDLDPLHSNFTPQIAFIDDGIVVPGTGGTTCLTWCYGPGGFVVNPDGGLLGPAYGIHNEIRSPVFAAPGTPYDGARLAFDIYVHLPHGSQNPHISYYWRVRSTTSPDPEDLETAAWQNDGLLYHGTTPQYLRFEVDLTPYLVPGYQHAQVAIGILEPDPTAGGNDATPAPYVDNVVVKAFEFAGPAMAAREAHLAQDAFPATGTIDYVDLAANSVRFDMARNISPPEHLQNVPGDSVVVTVVPARPGSVLDDLPKLRYRLRRNPLFDPHRFAGLPDEGWVMADSCRDEGGDVIPNRFYFDLPDEGFLFPGDELHYLVEAQDNLGGDIGTSLLPADTTGFGRFTADDLYQSYDAAFIVRALPTLFSPVPGDQPPVLFINDNPNRGNDNHWLTALRNLGYVAGTDYDAYWVSEPAAGVGNGIGGRATVEQLQEYRTVLYTCGDLAEFTLSNGDFAADPGDDLGVLALLLQTGDTALLACGDNLVDDLVENAGPAGMAFALDWLSVTLVDDDIRPWIDGQLSPAVGVLPGNPVFEPDLEPWLLLGLVPVTHRFDAVQPIGDAVALAEFLSPAGTPGQYPFAAATLHVEPVSSARIMSLPYDLASIGPPSGVRAPDPSAMRTRILEDILTYFGSSGSGPPAGVPDLNISTATFSPNETVYLLVAPNGHGHRLDEARILGGGLVDATITVSLFDGIGEPVPDYPAEDIWLVSELGGLVLCPGGSIADHDTDDAGQTTFVEPVAGGGYSDFGNEGTMVMISGEPLTQPPLALEFLSPDLSGDRRVDLFDRILFTRDYFGPYHLRSDFNVDGILDPNDIVIFARYNGGECGGVPPIPTPGTLPAATLGLYFDTAGTEQVKYADVGEPFEAYLLLEPTEPAAVLSLAFQLEFAPEQWYLVFWTWTGHVDGSAATGYETFWVDTVTGGPGDPILVGTCLLIPDVTDPIVIVPASHVDYADIAQMDPDGGWSYNVTASPAFVNPTAGGTVVVDPDPDGLEAPWHLVGDLGFALTANGDTTLTGMDPDTYTLTWLDVPGWFLPDPDEQQLALAVDDTIVFTGAYRDPRAHLLSLADVPNDQGRNLRLVWERSLFDAPDDDVEISGYGVYRRQDAYKANGGMERAAKDDPLRLEGWDFIAMVPAHGDSLYQTVAPTVCDSTDLGICWSVFFLRTLTPDPFTFWDSPPDSGYSIDNLVPGVPASFQVAYAAEGNALSWQENTDPDIRHYNVYRGELQGCEFPGGEPAASVATANWFDDLAGIPGHAWDHCYFVTAVDFAGNESDPTEWPPAAVTGLEELLLPPVVALHPSRPNPFNPRTTIRFDLPLDGRVELAIFDISGRRVRTLAAEQNHPAGRHEVVWDGTYDTGRRLSSGVYFCRLRAGREVQTQRLTLVK